MEVALQISGEYIFFQQMMLGTLEIHMEKNEMKFLTNAKINSRETNILNVKGKTIKLLVENMRLFS